MYLIKEFANLTGVTVRTLRYYDEIDLLKPHQVNEAGHRIYTEKESKQLQQILFLRELDFSLKETKELLANETNQLAFFEEQRLALIAKKDHLTGIIHLIEDTIKEQKGQLNMTDSERFKAFKSKQLKENRDKYGQEIIDTYGQESLESSEKKYQQLSEKELSKEMPEIESELLDLLKANVVIPSDSAARIYSLHAKWLSFSLDLTPQIHLSLVDMYLLDDRFKAYYDDKSGAGATQRLHDIVHFYSK